MDAMPDFDALDDDDTPRAQNSTALPAPGPVMSPDDPRFGRPMAARPLYSVRALPQGPVPQGPVMSPADPRHGRPASPPLIYSDRSATPPPASHGRGRGSVLI